MPFGHAIPTNSEGLGGCPRVFYPSGLISGPKSHTGSCATSPSLQVLNDLVPHLWSTGTPVSVPIPGALVLSQPLTAIYEPMISSPSLLSGILLSHPLPPSFLSRLHVSSRPRAANRPPSHPDGMQAPKTKAEISQHKAKVRNYLNNHHRQHPLTLLPHS